MKNNILGFTLIEVLITLVIIGVIAAITVPMLHNSSSEKEYIVARQKAHATIGEAFRLMTINGEIDKNITTEDFVKNVIPKYLKLAKSCGSGIEAAKECGFTDKIKISSGVKRDFPVNIFNLSIPKTATSVPTEPIGEERDFSKSSSTNYVNFSSENYANGYIFKTMDGFSVNFFYNPYCATNETDKYAMFDNYGNFYHRPFDLFCFNAMYDMNGTKGPNEVGKDIGFVASAFNGYNARTVSILPHNETITADALNITDNNYCLSASLYCQNLDDDNNWKLPDVYENSLLFNNIYFTQTKNLSWHDYMSSTYVPNRQDRCFALNYGQAVNFPKSQTDENYIVVRCIRK